MNQPQSFRAFLTLLSLLFVTATRAAESIEPAIQPTNFVIFLTDDQGWGDLGCYGHPRIQSPNLDRFAQQGLRLTQCYSACSVCSPSRSAILTGRTPYRNGVWRWIPAGSQYHLRASEVSIARLLRDRGYATCHAGKWHLNGKFNSDEQPQPDNHGYDWWLATQNNAAPNHLNPTNYVRNRQPVGKTVGPSSVIAVNEAIRWLTEVRKTEQPFFITIWTHEPHLPIESAEEFMRPYEDIDDEGIRQHHGNITQLDHAFGLLMKALDDQRLAQNTFVMFTSDNGPEGSGDKGRTRGSTGGLRGRKRHTHEGGIRVPGMVRWPGHIQPGSANETPVIGSDIFATVCDIANIPLPDDRTIDGASLVPMFQGQPIDRKQPLYWRNHLAPAEYRVALRDGDWKIIGSDNLSTFELYNIRKDWQETTDLSQQQPQRFAKLRDRLIAHDREVLADGPDWWKNDASNKRSTARQAKLPKGQDKTGDFAVVKGGVVTKDELGYRLTGNAECVALKKLDKPITGRVTFQLKYTPRTDANTRNAMLAFGNGTKDGELVKAGTAIGMKSHAIFVGRWQNIKAGALVPATIENDKTYDMTVIVDVSKRSIEAEVDGRKFLGHPLPESLRQITHLGYGVKGTSSAFSPIEIRQD